MKNKDIKYLLLFVILIILILLVLVCNYSKENYKYNGNRKIDYIFHDKSYNVILKEGEKLLLNGIKIVKNDFECSYDDKNNCIKYTILDQKDYKKLTYGYIIDTTLNDIDKEEYIKNNNIVYYENNYYIKSINKIDSNYVGSIINVDYYDKENVYYKLINYYCDNYSYIGILDDNPKCNYITKESSFGVSLINNTLRIKDISDIYNIIK